MKTIISELKKGDRFMFNSKVYIVKQKFSGWSMNDDAYLKTECGEKFYHDGLDVEKLND